MVRHLRTGRFEQDWKILTGEQRQRFRMSFVRYDADLQAGRFRAGLRVRRVEGTAGVFEMTWAPDGRATFQFAEDAVQDRVVVWRRIGTHRVFRRP